MTPHLNPQQSSNGQLLPLHPGQVLSAFKTADVKANLTEIWNMPYPADPILEPEKIGLTYGQVAMLIQVSDAAKGNGLAFDRVLDRMIGKPQTLNTNVNIGGSYKDFLDEVAKQESSQEGIIDAEFRTIDNPKDSAS